VLVRTLRLIGVLLLWALPQAALAWGPHAHRKVTERTIETLPTELKGFYKDHRFEMETLAFDDPELSAAVDETQNRFAIDRLESFPFTEVPWREKPLLDQYGAAAEGMGRLPWLIDESYQRLVTAFQQKDKALILSESDLLARLVTDLHNPLALTDNHDGQKTGQPGLWVRFSEKLPEAMGGNLSLNPDAAHYLDVPQDFVFSMINANYVWVDNILYLDELAKRGKSSYTQIYYDALIGRAKELVNRRLSEACEHAGSYWYSAWTEAGRPELK
jgi:hypothetical protein